MTHQLRSRDIIALGFMTFALFVGAGNIIFPSNGRLAGRRTRLDCGIRLPHYCRWSAGTNGSGAGKVGGGVDSLSTPIGKVAGVLLATVLLRRWGRFSLRRVQLPFPLKWGLRR